MWLSQCISGLTLEDHILFKNYDILWYLFFLQVVTFSLKMNYLIVILMLWLVNKSACCMQTFDLFCTKILYFWKLSMWFKTSNTNICILFSFLQELAEMRIYFCIQFWNVYTVSVYPMWFSLLLSNRCHLWLFK